MTVFNEIKTLMPDCVNTDSHVEFGGQTGYALTVDGETYFVNFENWLCPNFEYDLVEYNIPQEKIDALKVIMDRIITEHGYEPYEPLGPYEPSGD